MKAYYYEIIDNEEYINIYNSRMYFISQISFDDRMSLKEHLEYWIKNDYTGEGEMYLRESTREVIIQLLAKGNKLNEVALELKKLGYKPCSLSSVEKELKKLRSRHKANTNFHLACILMNKGYKLQ